MACIQVWFTPDFCFKLREDLLHYLIRPRDDTITIAAGPLFINTTFLPMSKVNASFDSRCDDDYTHQRRRPVLLFPTLLYPFSNQDAFYRRPSFFIQTLFDLSLCDVIANGEKRVFPSELKRNIVNCHVGRQQKRPQQRRECGGQIGRLILRSRVS